MVRQVIVLYKVCLLETPSEILKFLSQADMIKFAKTIPENGESLEALEWLGKET